MFDISVMHSWSVYLSCSFLFGTSPKHWISRLVSLVSFSFDTWIFTKLGLLVICFNFNNFHSLHFSPYWFIDVLYLSFLVKDNQPQPVRPRVLGRPILLALEDVDGTPSFLEKALRFIEGHGRLIYILAYKYIFLQNVFYYLIFELMYPSQ